MKATLTLLVAVAGGALFVQASEFPLEFKRLSLSEAQACPGGYGMSGPIQKSHREQVKSEPKPASAYALYGMLFAGEGGPMLFRLDESRGARQGFDRLIIDWNRNGDLKDDQVLNKNDEKNDRPRPDNDMALFGPVEAPKDRSVGSWRPVFYIETYVYNKDRLYSSGQGPGNSDYFGSLRCFSGWLLEATVEINGAKERIAFKDGNCNFHLGDPSAVGKMMRRPGDPGEWYLSVEDYLLRDQNDSRRFERSIVSDEAEGLSSIHYFGTKPYTVALSPDFKTVRLEPYTGALGELKVSDRVSSLVMAREIRQEKWEPLTPAVQGGKALLPPGNYRVTRCELRAKDAQGAMIAGQSDQMAGEVIKIEAGRPLALKLGVPIELKVTVTQQTGQSGSGSGLMAAARSLFGGGSSAKSLSLDMSLDIRGASGERYARFFRQAANQPGNWNSVDPPGFRILDAAGKLLASGKFEFG